MSAFFFAVYAGRLSAQTEPLVYDFLPIEEVISPLHLRFEGADSSVLPPATCRNPEAQGTTRMTVYYY